MEAMNKTASERGDKRQPWLTTTETRKTLWQGLFFYVASQLAGPFDFFNRID
ncbi:MAG: hypothetical protein ACOYD6_08605 [Limnochordia bacterium]|jgi:hypothetical protein